MRIPKWEFVRGKTVAASNFENSNLSFVAREFYVLLKDRRLSERKKFRDDESRDERKRSPFREDEFQKWVLCDSRE